MEWEKARKALLAVIATALLASGGGCAGQPGERTIAEDGESDNDPAETVNRAIFEANLAVDHAVLRPIAKTYSEQVPAEVRQGVHNVVKNLKEPAVAVNDLLQGNSQHAWQSVERLAVNTTVGGAGAIDVAANWGLPRHEADFGQTLGVWGVGEGPFVELPLLGPSNLRDAVGTAVDFAFDPLTYVGGAAATAVGAGRSGAEVVDTRTAHLKDLDELERNSVDYYAALRSVYRQHRTSEIQTAKALEQPKEGRVDISLPEPSP